MTDMRESGKSNESSKPSMRSSAQHIPEPGGKGIDQFEAPDTTAPYACTFHRFRLPDRSIVGLDVIRSDAGTDARQVNRMGLRVFLLSSGQPRRSLIEVHDRPEWDDYLGGSVPSLEIPLARDGVPNV